ncbi:MAG: cupin domain-containing protein [Gammaproteobacteria bacterium]|nr:cupin domain-containing protein [Gammaproteobacteria bacterium]
MATTLAAEPVGLDQLVSYQDGAIVSNTVHKDAAGTITAFAFDAGEGLSEHTAPFDAFLQVSEGEADVTIQGKPHRVRAGHIIRLPAGIPHAVHAATRFKMLLTMIRSR